MIVCKISLPHTFIEISKNSYLHVYYLIHVYWFLGNLLSYMFIPSYMIIWYSRIRTLFQFSKWLQMYVLSNPKKFFLQDRYPGQTKEFFLDSDGSQIHSHLSWKNI